LNFYLKKAIAFGLTYSQIDIFINILNYFMQLVIFMKKITSIIMVFIILGAFLIFLNPLSAGTIHVYPGDDIVAKIGAAESGDTVYIHSGTYDISAYQYGIEINNPNVTIIGDDPSNTIIDCSGGSAICIGKINWGSNPQNTVLDNTTIKNLTLRNFLVYGIFLNGNNVTIENCKFNLMADIIPISGDICCVFGNGDNWVIKNISMNGNKVYGGVRFRVISGVGNNWIVDGFEFDRNEFKSNSTLYLVVGVGDNWTIKNGTANNNTFENGGTFYGLSLGGTSSLIKNISVSGNKMLADTSFYGIMLVGENSYGEHSSIINCTVSNNALINNNSVGLVYGIYAYCPYISVENCIVTGNTASNALTPVYGIWTPRASYNLIKYSNSWNNKDNWGQTIEGVGQGLEPGEGCISTDPIFAKSPLGDFYLSNSSPCVDSGSESSIALGLYNGFTTRTDGRWDTGTVDMGFHYQSNGGSETQYPPVGKILKILKENQE